MGVAVLFDEEEEEDPDEIKEESEDEGSDEEVRLTWISFVERNETFVHLVITVFFDFDIRYMGQKYFSTAKTNVSVLSAITSSHSSFSLENISSRSL